MLKLWRRTWLPALLLSMLPAISMAQFGVSISVNLAPPELPVYEQPPIPAEGYLWSPGYWYWDADAQDYFWVPGTWVEAPQPGLLWTPGYWGYNDGAYVWNGGYWGPQVGFYGGVNYGFGYGGAGFEGGYWRDGHLFYNTAVVNVGTTHISNVYVRNVTVNNVTVNRVSFNGGSGGIQARPTAAEADLCEGNPCPPDSNQVRHVTEARSNPAFRQRRITAIQTIAATAKPGDFTHGVVAARGAPAHGAAPPHAAACRCHPPRSRRHRAEPRAALRRRLARRASDAGPAPVLARRNGRPPATARPRESDGASEIRAARAPAAARPPSRTPQPATPRVLRRRNIPSTRSRADNDQSRARAGQSHRFIAVVDGEEAVLDYTLAAVS